MATLDDQLASLDPDYVVHQVKEKYGTLCYYCEPCCGLYAELWEKFDAIVAEAARASAITCERCGGPGVLHKRNCWLKTLCPSCAKALGGYTPAPRRHDR